MGHSAAQFVERLEALRSPDATAPDDYHGIGMGQIFALAKERMDMAPAEIERLLESPNHEVRVGAVSIMDWQARDRKTTTDRRRELFELYIRRHDRIDTWDLVDRSAIWVVGEYLVDKPRDVLYTSPRRASRWSAARQSSARSRSSAAATSTTRTGSPSCSSMTRTTRAEGGRLDAARGRQAGRRRHAAFLEAHAATMPRVMLRYAIEKLDKPTRDRWLGKRQSSSLRELDPTVSMRPTCQRRTFGSGSRQVGPCHGDDRRHYAVGRPVDHLGPGGPNRGSFGAPSRRSLTQTTSQIGFTLLLVGVAAGFATAIIGGFDLIAPWLLIAYVLLLSDLVMLRWIGVHVARVRAAQNDPEADLKAVASSPRAALTLAVIVAF